MRESELIMIKKQEEDKIQKFEDKMANVLCTLDTCFEVIRKECVGEFNTKMTLLVDQSQFKASQEE